MNKRQGKKARTKKGAEALIGRNAYLERENANLRQEMAVALKGLEEVRVSFDANLGAITRLYGEKIEGYSMVKVPFDEMRSTISDYDVKCSIEDGKYIICVLPKVDPEAK
jgi:hypothetical protein